MSLANMSHEIRTPMNASSSAYLLTFALKTPLNPKQRGWQNPYAGTSLLAIINDILDFSKIEGGKLDLETTEFKPDQVISSVTTLTAQKAHEKGLEFLGRRRRAGDPGRSAGRPSTAGPDSHQLRQQRRQVHRAGRDSAQQFGSLSSERAGEKVQLKFSVRDTGIGMSQEQSAKLFQPFTQADMSTTCNTAARPGADDVRRRLVELMGGRIWLEE